MPSTDDAAQGNDPGLTAALARLRRLVHRFVPQGALLLTALTFGAYLMGLLRDRTFARTFGAGTELDAYQAAFTVGELFLDVLVTGGLAAPFVPIFLQLRGESERQALEFGQTVLTLATSVIGLTMAVLFVAAPLTAEFAVAGFDAAGRQTYIELFRISCLTQVLFAASIALGEILVAERRFLWYGLAPILYNGGTVVGVALLGDRMGIHAAAVGSLLGAVLHLGIRVIGIRRTAFRIRPRLAVRTKALREFVTLMIPRIASQPIEPLTFVFYTQVASQLAAGSITALNFARNFGSVPVLLIGVQFSIAAFPALSAAAAGGDRPAFLSILGRNVAVIGALTTVAAVTLFLIAPFVIDFFLGGGEFGPDDVATTAAVLSVFAVSIPLESLTFPLARAIYATRNTILPVLASVAGFAVTVGSTGALVDAFGITGIPLGFGLGSAFKLALLGVFLVPRLREVGRIRPLAEEGG